VQSEVEVRDESAQRKKGSEIGKGV
jgi:hypothetical protein